jgi:hypothetical protein
MLKYLDISFSLILLALFFLNLENFLDISEESKKDSMQDEYNPTLKNTADEIFYIKRFMIKNNMIKISIVSVPYQSRRIKILANLFEFKKIILS